MVKITIKIASPVGIFFDLSQNSAGAHTIAINDDNKKGITMALANFIAEITKIKLIKTREI
jgi:hypothetical protein